MPLIIGTRLGPYEIVSALGAGGMGEVYRARDPRLDRTVAIKLLPAHLTTDAVARERFRREALAAAALDHPFICKIFEIAESGGALFIVMEYVAGETLQARLANLRPSTTEALRIAGEIAEAIEAAHARRIVHRDLKPANVMLTTQGRVKVMDFGIAKQLPAAEAAGSLARTISQTSELTDLGTRVGTPDYMSPEQVLGETIDERSDLFSFGIVLCELLTGAHPFRRPTPATMMAAILRDPPAIELTGSTDLQPGYVMMVRRLLAKTPADRYASMVDVRADLARVSNASVTSSSYAPAEGPKSARRWPLVGRESERADLVRALDEAIAGRGSLVLVGGEPGIGKTRLTEELLAHARQRGCLCLVGHCYEMEGAPPYVRFIEIVEYGARVVPPAVFRHALGDAASEVARLMPELRRMFPDLPQAIELPPEQQRRFFFNAYREFMERACRVSPLAVVLEDLHWADEPTLLLLQHVAQTVGSAPLLVIGTYRDVELDVTRPFAKTLETLLRQRIARRMALHRLPVSGVEAMIGAMSPSPPPPSLARVIFEETEGNPFFVEEVFQHLAEEGKLFDEGGAWRTNLRVEDLDVPEGVKLVVGRRLARLGDTGRRVLTTAALIGRSFSLSLLEALEEQADAALDAVEEAERAHLVVAESSLREPRYRFAHELIRQTLAEAVSMPRRQRQHARIAASLERVYGASIDKHASALAHHLYQAGAAADREKTTRFLLLAAEQARGTAAHEDALAHVDNALTLWEGERSAAVARLHEQRGVALRTLGRTAEAIEAFRCAIGMFDEVDDIASMASASLALAIVHAWDLDAERSLRVNRVALDRLGEAAPALRCQLLIWRAAAVGQTGDVSAGFTALDEATCLRRDTTYPALDRAAGVVETHMWFFAMQPGRALDAALNAERHSPAQPPTCGSRWTWRTWSHGPPGAWAAPAMRRGSSTNARPAPNGSAIKKFFRMLRRLQGYLTLNGGDFEAAERGAAEARALSQAIPNGWGFLDETWLGTLAFCQGRQREAIGHYRRAVEQEPSPFFYGGSAALLFLALADERESSALDALGHPKLRLPVAGTIVPSGARAALSLVIEGLALLARGDQAAAHFPIAEDLLVSEALTVEGTRMFATSVGIAAASARNWSRAEEHHRAAIQQADRAPYRIAQPHARVWHAEMLVARGGDDDRDRARERLGEAVSMYEALRMPTFAQRTAARLSEVR